MLAIKMTIVLKAVGLMPLPGMTRADAEGQITEESKAKMADEIKAEWSDNMKSSGFELGSDSSVEVELVEV